MSKAKGRILVDGKVVAEFVDVTFTINKPIEPIEVINEQIVLPVFERYFGGVGGVVRIIPTWHPRDVIGNRERFAEMVAHFRYVCASLEK